MAGFKVKDSGKREQYDSGMVRDTQEGKPDYTLVDPVGLERVAIHLVKGAEKYGRENWRKANSEAELTRFKSSALRHIFQWLRGDTDEDHMAAVVFNLFAAEYVKSKLNNPSLDIGMKDGQNYEIKIMKCSKDSFWYAGMLGQVFVGKYEKEDDRFYIAGAGSYQLGAWIERDDVQVKHYV